MSTYKPQQTSSGNMSEASTTLKEEGGRGTAPGRYKQPRNKPLEKRHHGQKRKKRGADPRAQGGRGRTRRGAGATAQAQRPSKARGHKPGERGEGASGSSNCYCRVLFTRSPASPTPTAALESAIGHDYLPHEFIPLSYGLRFAERSTPSAQHLAFSLRCLRSH